MNIEWKISDMAREVSNGFVTTAHWIATAVDGDYTASIYSSVGWPEGSPVVPYSQLTEDTVLGWVWESVDKAATEAALAAKIAEQKTPVTATGLPWAA